MPLTTRARRGLAGAVTAALTASGLIALAAPSHAAAQEVTNATLLWGLNDEQGGGAFAGGCNFLSAGKAGNTGSSRTWTESDGFYKPFDGNVRVEKPNAAGTFALASWAAKCKDKNGVTVSSSDATSTTGTRVRVSNGAGSFDPATGAGSITWSGSFTSAFYGGMTYWSATDPRLSVDADGSATLTATASGYGTSMDDMTQWVPLTPRSVTLATFTGVDITNDGFTATPDYSGVVIDTKDGTPQTTSGAAWGSFPQDFVDFQIATGQSSYWYSSGGARDTAKPAAPLTLAFEAPPINPVASRVAVTPVTTQYGRGGTVRVTVSSSAAADGTVALSGLGATQTKPLSGGQALFAVPRSLAAKNYRATATYSGSALVTGGTATATVRIAKASSGRPTVKVSKRPTGKKKGKATITVKSGVAGLAPSGKVRITVTKGKSTKRVNATLRRGKASVSLPKLKKGTWKLKVSYAGSATHGPSTSKTYKVRSST